jgi:hypothetical protein
MSVYVRLGIRLLYKGLKSRRMEKDKSKPPRDCVLHGLTITILLLRYHRLMLTIMQKFANFLSPCLSSKAENTMTQRPPHRSKDLSISIS